MTVHDREGFELTGATPEARDLFERALELQRCYLGDPLKAMDRAIAVAPGFAMAHISLGWMSLIGTEPQGFTSARESHARAAELVATPHERAHLEALGQLAGCHFHAAAETLQRVSIDHPRDLLALQIGHHIDFFVGDARMMRDRIARALPEWSEDRPGYHLLPAMHAFGLEECGDYAYAEREGRRASALHPGDSWAQHAVAHVMEMQGRLKEGLAWMRDDPELWSKDSLLAIHNWWHTALYHLDLGEIDEVLALYDGPIFGAEPPFVLPLGDAATLLLPVIPIANRFGGSHAQRDVLDLTLIEAAFRAGDSALARAVTAERKAAKPRSVFTDTMFRKARAAAAAA